MPIKKRRALFISYYGAQYGCNPKYISEYIMAHHSSDVDVVWALLSPSKHCLPGVKTVRFGSILYWYMLATCRVIVTNYRMTTDFKKREGQTYIQTWHSSLRLKKIEADTVVSLPPQYVEMAKHDSAQTDYVIAGCQKSHDTFQNAFWFNGKILDIGTPRNDLLCNLDSIKMQALKKKIVGKSEKKIVLYAPTFRNNKSVECYRIDFSLLRSVLSKKFGGDWIVLLRLHPHLINLKLYQGEAEIIDMTKYDDIQELLAVSDVLISDYSSLMFDFAISGKPVFLFASDVDEYCCKERALYFSMDELPFSLSKNSKELGDNILCFDQEIYKSKIDDFNTRVGSFEKGTASKSIAELILNKIRK